MTKQVRQQSHFIPVRRWPQEWHPYVEDSPIPRPPADEVGGLHNSAP